MKRDRINKKISENNLENKHIIEYRLGMDRPSTSIAPISPHGTVLTRMIIKCQEFVIANHQSECDNAYDDNYEEEEIIKDKMPQPVDNW